MRIPSLKEITKRFDGADTVDDGVIGELSSPLCDLDMQTSFNMKAGNGSVSFARASGETGIDMYGDLVTKAVDEPVFNENGFQSREGSTNLLTYSELSLSTSSLNGGEASDSPSDIGFSTWIQIPDGNSATSYAYKNYIFTAPLIATFSCFIIMDDLSEPIIGTLTDSNADFSIILDGSVPTNVEKEQLANGLWRVSSVINDTHFASGNFGIQSRITNSRKGFRFTGFQLEEKPFVTPYIPTTDSPVTRANQFATLPAKYNLPSPTEGTIFCEFTPVHTTSLDYLVGVYSSSSLPFIRLYTSGNQILFNWKSKDLSFVDVRGNIVIGETTKVIIVYKEGVIDLYINGVLGETGVYTSGIDSGIYNIYNIRFGGYSSTSTTYTSNCDIKQFKTYSKALSDTAIKLLSGGN